MIAVPISTAGQPPVFNVDPTDQMYWLMRLCYEESCDRYALNQAGIELTQVEDNDVEALQTSINEALQDGLAKIDALYA